MYSIDKDSIYRLDNALKSVSNVVLCVHRSPDPDALGAVLAMLIFLRKTYNNIGNIHCLIPDDFPDHLLWLTEGYEQFFVSGFDGFDSKGKDLFKNADCIICLDLATPLRINYYSDLFEQSEALKINVDHHIYVYDGFDVVVRNHNASSTAEIIYHIIDILNKASLDVNVATALYAAILGDTGSFTYSCSHPQIYHITANLMEYGIDVRRIHDLVFNNYPYERTKLLGYVLNEKIRVVEVKHQLIAFYSLSAKELETYHYANGYLENVVNYALNIKDVQIAASFVERNKSIRISLRSKSIPINDFVAEYFGGGGHANASGAVVNDKSLEQCVDVFLENVGKCLECFLVVLDKF